MTWKEIFCYLIIYKGANDVPDQIDLQVYSTRLKERWPGFEYLNLIYCLFKQNFMCNALEIVSKIFWKSLCSLLSLGFKKSRGQFAHQLVPS